MITSQNENIGREKGLVGKLVEAGKLIGNTELFYRVSGRQEFNYYGHGGLKENIYRAKKILGIGLPPKRTEETESQLQRLFEGTPLYQILEEQQDFHDGCDYRDERTPLMVFSDKVRGKKYWDALNRIAKPVKAAYFYNPDKVVHKEGIDSAWEASNFVGSYRNKDYYGNRNVAKIESLQLADLAIVAGRLSAGRLEKDVPEFFSYARRKIARHYYHIAKLALEDASLTLGGIAFHFGSKVGSNLIANMEKTAQEIKRREEIVASEGYGLK